MITTQWPSACPYSNAAYSNSYISYSILISNRIHHPRSTFTCSSGSVPRREQLQSSRAHRDHISSCDQQHLRLPTHWIPTLRLQDGRPRRKAQIRAPKRRPSQSAQNGRPRRRQDVVRAKDDGQDGLQRRPRSGSRRSRNGQSDRGETAPARSGCGQCQRAHGAV